MSRSRRPRQPSRWSARAAIPGCGAMSDAIVCDGCGTTDREVQHSEELGVTLCGECFDARSDEATRARLRARLVDVRRFLQRFVVMSSAGLDVLAVWVVHTWLFDAAETTPYVSVRSPE